MNCLCPIWGTPAEYAPPTKSDPWVLDVDSPRAGGRYRVHRTTADGALAALDTPTKLRLTTWLTNQRAFGDVNPMLSEDIVALSGTLPAMSASERADRALKFIRDRTRVIGGRLDLSSLYSAMLPITESQENGEVAFLKDYLVKKGWLSIPVGEQYHAVQITIEGYSYLDTLDRRMSKSSQAFIAMWFDQSMDDAYNLGIVPGVRDAGYEPLRIDNKDHNNKIDDELIAEIRRSRFVVADFTQGASGARGGVYYEAGFAHGLTIPVIFTCRQDAIGLVHFDTRQYNHIAWREPDELRRALTNRISATIGDGPLRGRGR
jgi:hypothetical protein